MNKPDESDSIGIAIKLLITLVISVILFITGLILVANSHMSGLALMCIAVPCLYYVRHIVSKR